MMVMVSTGMVGTGLQRILPWSTSETGCKLIAEQHEVRDASLKEAPTLVLRSF